jgi:predicted 3-demethylubiquinone-9 3-methyltransferase (glyoxalase superfamily)
MSHSQIISYGLWFDSDAEKAATFYTGIFPNSKILTTSYYSKEGQETHKRPPGSVLAVDFTLSGSRFQAINGGPLFKINPSISFMIICDSTYEAEQFWDRLAANGQVLMPIDKYEWSEKYGWLQDQYGVSWQIYTGPRNEHNQKIVPMLMFTGKQNGMAKEAIEYYTRIFKHSKIDGVMNYPLGGQDSTDHIAHAQFQLSGQVFSAADGGVTVHKFGFNEGVSLVINCTTQDQIDYYWDQFTAAGQEIQCGWLKDKFGVVWQVVPVQLEEMITDPDQKKVDRVTKAFMSMKKFNIRELEEAFEGR